MITTVPPGYRRMLVLKELEYARDLYPPGAAVIVDVDTAKRWQKARLAEPAPLKAVPMTKTLCPKCGVGLEYVTTPEPDSRWTSCGSCGHGWLRD